MPRSRTQRNFGPKETKEMRVNEDGNLEEVEKKTHPFLRATFILIFLACTGAFVLYTIPQVTEYTDRGIGTTVQIAAVNFIDFPAMTVCNLQENVPLRFQACTDADGNSCFGVARNDTGNYACSTFNYDWRNPMVANKSGLHSLFTAQFTINKDLYPTGSGLFGAQVVLHESGTVPDIEANAIFLSPAQATILSLRKVQTNHLPAPKGKGGTTVSWDASPSILAVDGSLFKADEVIVVGMLYKEISVMDITEIETITAGALAGQLAGMLGTLLGLDVLNVSILIVSALFIAVKGSPHKKRDDARDYALEESGKGFGNGWHGSAGAAAAAAAPGSDAEAEELVNKALNDVTAGHDDEDILGGRGGGASNHQSRAAAHRRFSDTTSEDVDPRGSRPTRTPHAAASSDSSVDGERRGSSSKMPRSTSALSSLFFGSPQQEEEYYGSDVSGNNRRRRSGNASDTDGDDKTAASAWSIFGL